MMPQLANVVREEKKISPKLSHSLIIYSFEACRPDISAESSQEMKNQNCKFGGKNEGKNDGKHNGVTAKTSAEQKAYYSPQTKIKTVKNIDKMTIESVRTTQKLFQ